MAWFVCPPNTADQLREPRRTLAIADLVSGIRFFGGTSSLLALVIQGTLHDVNEIAEGARCLQRLGGKLDPVMSLKFKRDLDGGQGVEVVEPKVSNELIIWPQAL